jgi:hypothetical protein
VENWKIIFNQDGREILTAGEGGEIIGYDVETREVTTNIKGPNVFATSIAYVRNSQIVKIRAIIGGSWQQV